MLSLFAMNFHAARLGFEAQNAMAFRLMRLVSNTTRTAVPDIVGTEMAEPPPVQVPEPKVLLASRRRASASKVQKKSSRKVAKRSK
jgi:hypothetical protein